MDADDYIETSVITRIRAAIRAGNIGLKFLTCHAQNSFWLVQNTIVKPLLSSQCQSTFHFVRAGPTSCCSQRHLPPFCSNLYSKKTLRNEEKDAKKSPRFFPARGLQVLFCEQKRLRHRSFYSTILVCPRASTSTSHQHLYSPVWASASWRTFLQASLNLATVHPFFTPTFFISSKTPSLHLSLRLPILLLPYGMQSIIILRISSPLIPSTCSAHLSPAIFDWRYNVGRSVQLITFFVIPYSTFSSLFNWTIYSPQ